MSKKNAVGKGKEEKPQQLEEKAQASRKESSKPLTAPCRLCGKRIELADGKYPEPDHILIPLKCGHTWNRLTGWCYDEKQMQDPEKLLVATANYLYIRHATLKRRLEEVINAENLNTLRGNVLDG